MKSKKDLKKKKYQEEEELRKLEDEKLKKLLEKVSIIESNQAQKTTSGDASLQEREELLNVVKNSKSQLPKSQSQQYNNQIQQVDQKIQNQEEDKEDKEDNEVNQDREEVEEKEEEEQEEEEKEKEKEEEEEEEEESVPIHPSKFFANIDPDEYEAAEHEIEKSKKQKKREKEKKKLEKIKQEKTDKKTNTQKPKQIPNNDLSENTQENDQKTQAKSQQPNITSTEEELEIKQDDHKKINKGLEDDESLSGEEPVKDPLDNFVVVNSSEEEEDYDENEQEEEEEGDQGNKSSPQKDEGNSKQEEIGEQKNVLKSRVIINKNALNDTTSQKKNVVIKKKKKKIEKPKLNFCDNYGILIFLITLTLLLGGSKVLQEKYLKIKRLTMGDGSESDLYQILEVERSASIKQIKQSYKKLAILWHPDKNPHCGKPCEEKFTKIVRAYEILADEEKKLIYDQTQGTITRIKSKATSLTEQNFESQVLESNDIWIIMVYEDGHQFCEYISKFWESSLSKFKHIVKFGRINREHDRGALKYLSTHITILPTILSFAQGYNSELYVYDRLQPENSLFRFISNAIINKVKIFDDKDAPTLFKELTQYNPLNNNNKLSLIYFSSINKLPTDYKYAAYKYSNNFDFYASKYGSLRKVEEIFGLQKGESQFMLLYNDDISQKRARIEFKMNTLEWEEEVFSNILGAMKFLVIPQLDRSNFKDFCERMAKGEDLESLELQEIYDRQTFCIVIEKDHFEGKLKQIVQELQNQIISNQMCRLKDKKSMWEPDYKLEGVQFVQYDSKFHWRLSTVLQQAYNSNYEKDNKEQIKNQSSENIKESYKKFLAVGILTENRKASYIQNLIQFEDWVLDILEGGSNQDQFLYLEEFVEGMEISSLLKFQWETQGYLVWKIVRLSFFNWTVIVATLGVLITLWKFMKKQFLESVKLSGFVYLAAFILSNLIEFKREFLN